jgi:Kef-type K+ transport system membrane component KefB
MPYGTAVSLFVIAAAVAIAPLCSEALGRWRVPSVLFELLLGILIGPEVLHWASLDPFVNGLDALGLSFLFFMAGYEIDFARLTGAPLRLGVIGWLGSLVLGLGVGLLLLLADFAISSLLVGLAFLAARPQPPRVMEALQRHLGTSTPRCRYGSSSC